MLMQDKEEKISHPSVPLLERPESPKHTEEGLSTVFIRSFPTGSHHTIDNSVICNKKHNVKQMPYIQY